MTRAMLGALGALVVVGSTAFAEEELSVETVPPVVVKTVPQAGATGVSASLTEIHVTFSKPMQDKNWSWVRVSQDSFPEMTGDAHYLKDGKTCVLPVKLEPGRTYATWLNHGQYNNFKDEAGRPAVPYLLVFKTAPTGGGAGGTPSVTD